MSKLAVLTDVHADLHTLEQALARIDAMAIERIVCLGDLVDYGFFPDETLDLLQARGIPTIAGNHDRWALTDNVALDLSRRSRHFLASLPPTRQLTLDKRRIVLWHARPGSDMDGIPTDISDAEADRLLDEAEAEVLLVGHTHRALVKRTTCGLIANPGALIADTGCDDIPLGGHFGLLDAATLEFSVYSAHTGERRAL